MRAFNDGMKCPSFPVAATDMGRAILLAALSILGGCLDSESTPSDTSSEERSLTSSDLTQVQAAPDQLYYVRGQLEATGAWLSVERSVVEALLPPQIALAPQTVTDADHHPLVIYMGRQRGVNLGFAAVGNGGHVIPDYNEIIVLIPAVQPADPMVNCGHVAGPYFYMPALLLDDAEAWAIGASVGLEKRMATFEISDGRYKASTDAGLALDAHFGQQMVLNKPGAQKIADLFAIMGQPFDPYQMSWLEVTGLGALRANDVIYYNNDSTFYNSRETSELVITPQLLDAVGHRELRVRGVNQSASPLGSFHFRSDYEIREWAECQPPLL